MQRLLKFLHTLGAIGFAGSILGLIVLNSLLPETTSLPQYADARFLMSSIAKSIFLPSLLVVLLAGMLSMALNRSFHSAGWALTKLATSILIFEGGLVSIQGPMQREAQLSADVLAGVADPDLLGSALGAEKGSLWVLLAVAVANVALATWRPRNFWPRSRRPIDSDPV
jgi:hypothetical protein